MSIITNISLMKSRKHFIQIIFLFLTFMTFSKSSSCPYQVSIDTATCFNDVLKFSNKKYRAGHFVTSKNKDLFVEFSDDGGDSDGFSRIFYSANCDRVIQHLILF